LLAALELFRMAPEGGIVAFFGIGKPAGNLQTFHFLAAVPDCEIATLIGSPTPIQFTPLNPDNDKCRRINFFKKIEKNTNISSILPPVAGNANFISAKAISASHRRTRPQDRLRRSVLRPHFFLQL